MEEYEKLDEFMSEMGDLLDNNVISETRLIEIFAEAIRKEFKKKK